MKSPKPLNQPDIPFRVVQKDIRLPDGRILKSHPVKVYLSSPGHGEAKARPRDYGLGPAFSFGP
jgi:hypothetical protein